MRIFAAMVLLCLASLGAEAKQSPYPVTPFEGDKYSARQAQMGADVAKAVQIKRHRAGRHLGPRRGPNGGQRWRHVPIPAPRQVPIFAPLAEQPPSSAPDATQRVVAFTQRVFGRPAAWCGWWLGQHLGMPSRHLWLARNWASVGSSAGGPRVGAIVVWQHHVGLITGHNSAGWIVKSGNDGHRVRERVRSLAGAIAFRSSS